MIHDCFEQIFEKELRGNEELIPEVKYLVDKKTEVFKKIKGFDEQKTKFMKIRGFKIEEIEQTLAVSYAQFKAWDNDISLASKALRKIKKLATTTV